MPDQDTLRRLGIDVKRRIDAIARAVALLSSKYVEGRIKGRQYLAGLRNAAAKVEQQVDRLDVTVLDGQVEDMSGFNNDSHVMLGGLEEDMTKLNAPDELDAADDVDFD